jgi:long-subunit acyl-CoA synthetase (AMP-forming)
MGVLMAGAMSAGIYPTDTAVQATYKTLHCGARVAVVEDMSRVARLNLVS